LAANKTFLLQNIYNVNGYNNIDSALQHFQFEILILLLSTINYIYIHINVIMKSFLQFQFNCDRLWKLWYSILVIFTQIILIIFAISNYITYKSQAFDPRYGNSWSMIPLNFQLGSIILSISLLVWLIYSCMFKVGHIANDGTELGLDSDSIKKALIEISSHKGISLFG